MNKIECNNIQDFGGSMRKYFNCTDIRLMLVNHYEDKESWHKHNITSQIIFVMDGRLQIFSKDDSNKINLIAIGIGEFIYIPSGEWHKVVPLTETTKILVIKYKSSGNNIIEEIKKDYVKE